MLKSSDKGKLLTKDDILDNKPYTKLLKLLNENRWVELYSLLKFSFESPLIP